MRMVRLLVSSVAVTFAATLLAAKGLAYSSAQDEYEYAMQCVAALRGRGFISFQIMSRDALAQMDLEDAEGGDPCGQFVKMGQPLVEVMAGLFTNQPIDLHYAPDQTSSNALRVLRDKWSEDPRFVRFRMESVPVTLFLETFASHSVIPIEWHGDDLRERMWLYTTDQIETAGLVDLLEAIVRLRGWSLQMADSTSLKILANRSAHRRQFRVQKYEQHRDGRHSENTEPQIQWLAAPAGRDAPGEEALLLRATNIVSVGESYLTANGLFRVKLQLAPLDGANGLRKSLGDCVNCLLQIELEEGHIMTFGSSSWAFQNEALLLRIPKGALDALSDALKGMGWVKVEQMTEDAP